MMTLMQLISILGSSKESLESLESWCMNIAQDNHEVYEFADTLEDQLGVELSDIQLERLVAVCNKGTFRAAFRLQNVA